MIRFFQKHIRSCTLAISFIVIIFLCSVHIKESKAAQTPTENEVYFTRMLQSLTAFGDRSVGSFGEKQTAKLIKNEFKNLGFKAIDAHKFSMPVRRKTNSRITILGTNTSIEIDPLIFNAISPDTVASPGITGDLVYVGTGEIEHFNDKIIKDSVVLMELDSGKNWVNALSLGAKALIYIQKPDSNRFIFEDKYELSPVKFPRFLISQKSADLLFSDYKNRSFIDKSLKINLISDLKWENVNTQNIYCMIPGNDDLLKNELIVVEGFYDTSSFVAGKSPGADQACSAASLLDIARFLKSNPVQRSVLLVATSGHAASLTGMREMIWALKEKSKSFKKIKKKLKKEIETFETQQDLLSRYNPHGMPSDMMHKKDLDLVQKSFSTIIKSKIDVLNQTLMQLRLERNKDDQKIKTLNQEWQDLKNLNTINDLTSLTKEEKNQCTELINPALSYLKTRLASAKLKYKNLKSSIKFRKLAKSKKIKLFISLHLSSHGNGFGAFNKGWLYPLKKEINRFPPYTALHKALSQGNDLISKKLNLPDTFKDTLRPSLHRSWQSYFLDTPPLGGEVSALSGFLGVTFATTNDARNLWGTPQDTFDTVNIKNAVEQSSFIANIIGFTGNAKKLTRGKQPKNGFATITGQANFLRHGEVFANTPAPGSMILSFQGPGIHHNMVDASGQFTIKGVADKKHILHKVIIEGYKFDSRGETIWAVDKKRTTKARYRIKVKKKAMRTDLVMFSARQTTIVNLLEPRTFQYMTKIQVLDARLDSAPVKHWYSRIDTRSSIISSIYLEPGTKFKLTLSDSLLTKKLILTNADIAHTSGTGYKIDKSSIIAPTQFLAAKDMWILLNPRIDNLENKGINNQKIRDLRLQGNADLADADHFYKTMKYDKFFESAGTALALAGRVYQHVEKIQKDVLYGVLFYILLFVPFAFCLERFAFSIISIYKRILAFLGILVTLITIIYNVHPAFELAYSPIVIILAFFIMGLSAMVTWIIFQRFEDEMKTLQRQGDLGDKGEISFLKAFAASFFMGVSNLRRRKTRTVLTCTTLIILTFTLMSFTSVKNIRQHSKLLYNEKVPYQGLLLKQLNWKGLPQQAFKIIKNAMADTMTAAPRAWLENENRTQTIKIPVTFKSDSKSDSIEANALLGLSPQEPNITGLSKLIIKGRWFSSNDKNCIILPERMAKTLKIYDKPLDNLHINLWSIPFKVIGFISGNSFDNFKDLDGESLTPVTFPDEIVQKITDAEMEALESGDDIKSFQSRYNHIPFDQTLIIPYDTLISMGGTLKSVALKYNDTDKISSKTYKIIDRFGLWLFSGEKNGVYIYNASDTLNYSGIPNVIIPILISIFIVLNTMIGSVYERKREIGIYTSIGMAPSHVSIIFIAEALSYAVISVVLGYILAQSVAKVFAGTVLLSGITVNYSSLAGVFAMIMVMLVVILSSIYPSKIAAAIAIPDVDKSWEMSKAKGDQLNIDLPFLMKKGEELSAAGYLYDFFFSHQEVSHGIFSVADLELKTRKDDINDTTANGTNYDIYFTAWLAPFDLGVMQDVKIHAQVSETQEGYMELDMIITRKAGEHDSWWRVNKRFVNIIRKQLLIWRSLDETQKEKFKNMINALTKEKTTIV